MISIILPIKNEGRWVDITLDSLFYNIKDKELIEEIILVYDGNDQNTDIITTSFIGKIKKVILSSSIGPAGARNKGALIAKGDFLLFLDAHIYWEEGSLTELLKISDGQYILGANIGDIRQPGVYGNVLALKNLFLESGWKLTKPLVEYVPSIGGAFIFVPKKVFNEIGGFNKYFRGWGLEDIEFGWRANLMGYKILISEVKIAHRFSKKFDRFSVDFQNILFNKLVFWYLYLRTTSVGFESLKALLSNNTSGLDILNKVLKISKDLQKDFIYKFKMAPSEFLKINTSYHDFLQKQKFKKHA